MSEPAAVLPALTVRTLALDEIGPLVPLLDPRDPLLFVRRGQGVAGFGEAVRLEFTGEDRMREASAAWRELVSLSEVSDAVDLPGTGLIALGSFAFSRDSAATSVLIVPSVIVGRRDGKAWITRIVTTGSDAPDAPVPTPTAFGPEYRISLLPGAMKAEAFTAAVDSAIAAIAAGTVRKVVIARDLVGHLPEGADLRRVLSDLAVGYPDCFTYSVNGFIGSSPETLVRVDHGEVSARVLAGSIGRGSDADSDQDAAVALATSTKDLDEHAFALASVLRVLEPHSNTLMASELPFTLKLPNLWHLASDVEGRLSDGSSSLDLIAALHPTAAVAGAPTGEAMDLIEQLEPFDRGRYAGPVGWVGANGDGEWAVALRCAHVSSTGRITAYAGAGIVVGSEPERELAETKMKFRPIVEAFR
ncbi:isochorismate synthase [Glaciihabitans arcticus]|uniref:isochorismate synthase n=1 Tax=Glaciihabitans arcticus TaxID=2668039 RepID=A0A4V6MTP6_9MICO|nr:chorismate-binding protein [Glaciihabitans arcticus]TBN58449.1 isochorismate synthase [Glaciihabitans arcticus]